MEVLIEKMDQLGNGIGYVNNKIVFVPKTVTGDIVDINITKEKNKFCEGTVNRIIKSSEERMDSFCPFYNKCNGCHLQNFRYEKTLEYKKNRVKEILNKINYNGIINIVKCDNEKYYRNKIELKVKNKVLGFYEKKSHNIAKIDKCMITKNVINNFFNELNSMNIINGDILIRCNYKDELLISINTNDDIILKDNYSKYNVVGILLNNKIVYGKDSFVEKIKNYFFEVSYNAFFQINNDINDKLFEIINENVEKRNVLDLYSGVGTLSIMASQNANKVYGIEIIENAVINAKKNIILNNINNVEFILGDVQNKINDIKDKIDTIILDPPRGGIDKNTINSILKINPNKIIFISCEAQKMCEDLKSFINLYDIKKVYVLDMFPYTYHCETICVLERKN